MLWALSTNRMLTLPAGILGLAAVGWPCDSPSPPASREGMPPHCPGQRMCACSRFPVPREGWRISCGEPERGHMGTATTPAGSSKFTLTITNATPCRTGQYPTCPTGNVLPNGSSFKSCPGQLLGALAPSSPQLGLPMSCAVLFGCRPPGRPMLAGR